MTCADLGLAAFVLVVVADALGLVIDLCFLLTGQPTITSGVTKSPRWGIAILTFQLAGVVGLMTHFYGR